MNFIPLLFALGALFMQTDGLAPVTSSIIPIASRGSGSAESILSQYRLQHGLNAVVQDPRLQRAAQMQADAMARADVLSHDVAGDGGSRLDALGIPWQSRAENVSAGYQSVSAVFEGWKRSPLHNANLLKPTIRRFGIAVARGGGRYKTYWAIVMTD